jgi:hypothetical protein
VAAGVQTARATIWTLPGNTNTSDDAASVSVQLGGATTTTAGAPAAPLGDYTTSAPRAKPASRRALATATATPRSGTVVKPVFTVAAKTPARVAAVAFTLDGKRKCVDRAAPFRCRLKARAGWHTVAVRPVGGRATVVRLRVAR